MSDLQGRRIPGEEGSGRRRRWIWLVLGLILLLLLAALIPFACQALNGGSGQSGSGAQGDAGQNADEQGNGADDQAQDDGAQGDQAQDEGASGSGTSGSGASGDRSGEPQQVATARLSVRDQNGAGEAVTVPTATVEGTEGWLAVRADEGGRPGEVLGRAPLRNGTNEDVRVELREPLNSSQRLYTTIHAERPADGSFTYPNGDPTLERNGSTVAQPISYMLASATASSETANDAAARGGGIRDDELPESGGVTPGVLLAAGAFLLLSSAVVFASLRRLVFR